VKKQLAGGAIAKAEAESKLKGLKARFEEIQGQRKTLTLAVRYREPGKNSAGGFSQCTPVCDGRHVYVGFGNGLVACYDLEGNRKWLRLIEHSTLTYHHGASPVLVGDKLLVHYADLVALSIEDGSECWRAKVPANYGTSIACKVAGEDAVVHPNGFLVRVRDGHVLADKMGSTGPNSPIVHDGTAYFIRNDARAVRLPVALTAPVKTTDLWQARLKGGGYWFASPILHDGLVYGLSAQGILNVIDGTTGEPVYEQRLELEGQVYASVARAGGLIFISSDAGITVVVQPGREYKELARNTLEPFRSTPVFEGNRMYVRGQKHLYCIGE
jgi:outer membrane protein assembly factor BamB